MDFELNNAIEILERTPVTLRALLSGISDKWTENNEGPDTWSPEDVVRHLIQGEEEDWIPRARIILDSGESEPFVPFERFAFKKRYAEEGLPELLDRFEKFRKKNLEALVELNLTGDRLQLCGTHPEFGKVTMGQLIATWAVHDLSHIVQIARAMAKQYQSAVGPWRKYLSLFD